MRNLDKERRKAAGVEEEVHVLKTSVSFSQEGKTSKLRRIYTKGQLLSNTDETGDANDATGETYIYAQTPLSSQHTTRLWKSQETQTHALSLSSYNYQYDYHH